MTDAKEQIRQHLVSLAYNWEMLAELWADEEDIMNIVLTSKYPFTEGFDILSEDVREWVDSSIQKIDRL